MVMFLVPLVQEAWVQSNVDAAEDVWMGVRATLQTLADPEHDLWMVRVLDYSFCPMSMLPSLRFFESVLA